MLDTDRTDHWEKMQKEQKQLSTFSSAPGASSCLKSSEIGEEIRISLLEKNFSRCIQRSELLQQQLQHRTVEAQLSRETEACGCL